MIGRIWYFLKTSFNSCLASKKRTAIFIALILFFAIIIGLDNVPYSWGIAAIGYVLYVSYGMQFAGELISDREFLPKFDFKAIPIGIKALIVLWVYGALQALILWGISTLFNFPSFEFEKFFLEFSETFHLILTHSPVDTVLFFALSIVITYIFGFFMEIALAHLVDNGSLVDAFNFKLLKHYIDHIGWVEYVKDYTAVVLALLIISSFEFIPVLEFLTSSISCMLIFMVEFGAINVIYKKMKN